MTESVKTETPHLTDIYHKVKRNYCVTAGFLLAWELVGIELEEVPLKAINAQLKSPEAVPVLLLTLLGYYCVRVMIEWRQNARARTNRPVSRIDNMIAHLIALVAIVVFVVQRVTSEQVMDLVWVWCSKPVAWHTYSLGAILLLLPLVVTIVSNWLQSKLLRAGNFKHAFSYTIVKAVRNIAVVSSFAGSLATVVIVVVRFHSARELVYYSVGVATSWCCLFLFGRFRRTAIYNALASALEPRYPPTGAEGDGRLL